MTTLTLISAEQESIRPLVESALAREAGLIEIAIRQTQARLRTFEAQYEMSTDEFLRRFANDEIAETLDLDEWIGESRLLDRLFQKQNTLQGIAIVG